jgi:hypothetical protein
MSEFIIDEEIKGLLKEVLGIRWYEKIDGTPSETMEVLKFFLNKFLTDRDFEGKLEERRKI